MERTAAGLISRAAHELGLRTDELTAEVEQRLRHELPALWEDPDVARTVAENVVEHVVAALAGLEHAVEPDLIELPSADVERARVLARHGTPLSAMLRAFRLAEEIVLDRLFAELPRLSQDAEQVSAAARQLNVVSTKYVDRVSEQGVRAFQTERDRRLRWRSAMVNEASMCIGTTLDIARTTQELADFATEQFADLVTVDLLDTVLRAQDTAAGQSPLTLRRMAQGPDADAGGLQPPVRPRQLHVCPEGSPCAEALSSGRPSRQQHGRASGVPRAHSSLVVPLRARGTTLGVAEFHRYGTAAPYDDEDLLLAQEIAARAAVAVDNARHYTHARATALTLQRSLLPREAPRQSAVDVAYRYLPAGSESGVGGDWYDVIPLSGARVALVVGDVVGHGIRAAATMGRLRTAVRTLADIDLPPDELLTHLDDVVLRLANEASSDPDTGPEADVGRDNGATCLYAVYDPVALRCTLARAGHVPPVVVVRDGTADVLELPPGPPLGRGGLPFETMEVDLPEGSLIALCTDGLIEARTPARATGEVPSAPATVTEDPAPVMPSDDSAPDIDAGLATLRQVLARPASSLEAACDSVLEALLPSRPDDDVALLLARTRSLGADRVATWELEADPAVVGRARSDVSRKLTDWGLEELAFVAELVVSELVTNAIRYGRPPIRLRLIHDRSLLCEVSDAGSTTPHLRRARVFDEGGRGLLLVAQLAGQWGTRHARRGKTVWAELSETAEFPALAFE
ncbi:phosphatase [Streptomyces sp. WAC 01325]|uniref:ATP-binding SpoIIE family protein phosphatase n=1 Tax=Streptomyces TaxID=1883 RepID=UPI000F87AF6A|nr:SpoIIE family protein phosphatase [Streptomyces sp. WAC 01325]RSM97930.1 phosphatase [Streptomyces sp. WAC 01325]